MSDSTEVIAVTDQADAEVELSAQDLRALSASMPMPPAPVPPPKVSPQKTIAPPPSRTRHATSARVTVSLAAAIGIVGAAYVLIVPDGAKQPAASEQTISPVHSTPQHAVAQPPVRFANPFDTREVFEFPPGTSETQAREAVAALLMERAIARQKT